MQHTVVADTPGWLGIRMLWNIITDFGDSAAMLPAAGLLLGWLALSNHIRAAALWAFLFAAQSTLVAATKIAFRGWGIGLQSLDFTGISGHTTLASSVIPIGLYLLLRRAERPVRITALIVGLALGVVIGVSRVALGQHSWSEVIAGAGLGSLVAVLFTALADTRAGSVRLPAPAIAGALAAVLVVAHGTHAPSERIITKIALHLSGRAVPYRREAWLRAWPTPWESQSAARSRLPALAGEPAPVIRQGGAG